MLIRSVMPMFVGMSVSAGVPTALSAIISLSARISLIAGIILSAGIALFAGIVLTIGIALLVGIALFVGINIFACGLTLVIRFSWYSRNIIGTAIVIRSPVPIVICRSCALQIETAVIAVTVAVSVHIA